MADRTDAKTCSRCKAIKTRADFYRSARAKDGLQSQCKACARISSGAWAQANQERRRASTKRWREANAERWRDSERKRKERNADLIREQMRAYRERNAEQIRERMRLWRAANPDKIAALNARRAPGVDAARLRAVRAADPDYDRKWRNANPDKVREKWLRRRARQRSAATGFVDVSLLWQRQCGICPLCSRRINGALRHPDPMSKSIDHIFPLAKGGSHSQANLQWTHLVCNLSKGAAVPN